MKKQTFLITVDAEDGDTVTLTKYRLKSALDILDSKTTVVTATKNKLSEAYRRLTNGKTKIK